MLTRHGSYWNLDLGVENTAGYYTNAVHLFRENANVSGELYYKCLEFPSFTSARTSYTCSDTGEGQMLGYGGSASLALP